MKNFDSNNPYLLLTPGPLSTSESVRHALLKDWCTWDKDYGDLVQEIRQKLVSLAQCDKATYTSVLMQGSGTFSIESVLGSVISDKEKLLILTNGAYGKRMVEIAEILSLNFIELDSGELQQPQRNELEYILEEELDITHIAFVHCETTTGMLNPLDEICSIAKRYKKKVIVDSMSSFGGIPIQVEELDIDYIVSSANKCIQGVPGFGFVVAKREEIEKTKGNRKSLSLDLYDQWESMEEKHGKWRFTSPTHTVRAFLQALIELDEEGLTNRFRRYSDNQKLLVLGMEKLGFSCLLPHDLHSPIITTFISPANQDFQFERFYELLKSKGFVIYPGKVTKYECFRIGNIGEIYIHDIQNLLKAIEESMYWISAKELSDTLK